MQIFQHSFLLYIQNFLLLSYLMYPCNSLIKNKYFLRTGEVGKNGNIELGKYGNYFKHSVYTFILKNTYVIDSFLIAFLLCIFQL